MKFLYSVIITLCYILIPNGLYILSVNLFKFEQFKSAIRIKEGYQLISLAIYIIVFFLIVIFLLKKRDVKKNKNTKPFNSFLFSLFLVYLVLLLTNSIYYINKVDDQNIQTWSNITEKYPIILLLLIFFNDVIIQPINEELIFRGYILRKFIKENRTFIVGILFSSVLFASIHFNPLDVNYKHIISMFILGLILGFIFYRFGLVASIVSHVFFNTIYYLYRFVNIDLILTNYIKNDLVYWTIITFVLITLIALIYKNLIRNYPS